MCIAVIILNYSQRFPLIVVHNREEDVDRQTSSLVRRDNVLAAFDFKSGGVAAVGMNVKTGTFAVLTNCRKAGGFNTTGESRGKLVQEIIEDLNPDIAGRIFQGGFHLIKGNAFIIDSINIQYLTNMESSIYTQEDTSDSKELKIIVIMNNHAVSQCDWAPKLEYVKRELLVQVAHHPHIQSERDLTELITSVLSQTGDILPPLSSDFDWSPNPGAEKKFQRCIIVPPTQIGMASVFGTISQTVFLTDAFSRRVVYKYREAVDFSRRRTQFSDWDERVISYYSSFASLSFSDCAA